MVVVAITGLLVGIAVPTFNGIRIKQDFQEETTHIADMLADARGNAISSKQCTLSDDSKVQSKAWAMRINNEGGGDYTLQLLCQEYEDNDSSGDFDFIPQSATGHDASNEFKRTLSTGGRITRISPLSVPTNLLPAVNPNTGFTLTGNTFSYDGAAAPQVGTSHLPEYMDTYDTFMVVYTDLSEEIYIDVEGANSNAADFDPVWYLMIENPELGYEHVEADSGRFVAHPYGICMDNRKGFPQMPCNLIYDTN